MSRKRNKKKPKRNAKGQPVMVNPGAQGPHDGTKVAAKHNPNRDAYGYRKKKTPNIVPVGGETPLGMYSGGKRIPGSSPDRKYATQTWKHSDKAGRKTPRFEPAFKIRETKKGKSRVMFPNNTGMDSFSAREYDYGSVIMRAPRDITETSDVDGDLDLPKTFQGVSAELPENIWNKFKSEVSENSVLSHVASSFSTVTGYAKPTADAGMWLLEQVEDKAYNPRNRVLGTMAVMLDPYSSTFGDPGKSWDESYGLHYGQAVANTFLNTRLAAGAALTQEGDFRTYRTGDWDQLTDAQRIEAQREVDSLNQAQSGFVPNTPTTPEGQEAIRTWAGGTWEGRYISGMATLGTEIGLDPFVAVGKFVKVTKPALTGANLIQGLGKNNAIRMFDNSAALGRGDEIRFSTADELAFRGVDENGQRIPATKRQIKRQMRKERKAARHAKTALISMKAIADSKDAVFISKTHLVRNSTSPEAFSHILSEMDNVDDVSSTFRYYLGDEGIAEMFKARHASIADELDIAKSHDKLLGTWNPRTGKYEQLPPTSLMSRLKDGAFDSLDEERAALDAHIRDLMKRDDDLATLLDPDTQKNIDIVGQGALSKGGVSRFATIENHRINKAQRMGTAVTDTKIFHKNIYSIPIRVVRWAGQQRPDNYIPIAGISDTKSAGESFTAWVRSANVLNPAQRAQYMRDYMHAVAKGDAAVSDVLDEIEYDIAVKYAIRDAVRTGRLKAHPSKAYNNRHWNSETKRFDSPDKPERHEFGGGFRNFKDTPKHPELAEAKRLAQSDVGDLPEGGINRLLSDKKMNDGALPRRNSNAGMSKQNTEDYKAAVKQWDADVKLLIEQDKIIQQWMKNTRQFQRKRDAQRQIVNDRGGYAIDSDGTLLTIPQYETQLKSARPMMDWKRFQAVSRDVVQFNGNKNFATAASKAKWGAIAVNTAFQRVYRPMVLLALKYTPRNIFDAVLRNAAVIGGGMIDPNLGKAAVANTRRKGRKVANTVWYGGKKKTAREIDSLSEGVYGEQGSQTLANTLRKELDELNLKAGDPDFEDYKDMAKLFDEQAARAARKKTIEEELPGLEGLAARDKTRIKQLHERLDQLLAPKIRATDYELSFGTKQRKRDALDDEFGSTIENPDGVTFAGLSGEGKAVPREIILSEFSARDTMMQMFKMRSSANMKNYKKQLGTLNSRVKPNDSNYWDELHHFGTRVLRGSKVAKMRAKGATDAEVLKWFNSAEGSPTRRFAESVGKKFDDDQDVLAWFDEGQDSLFKYFPDPEMRRKVIDGEDFTIGELKAAQSGFVTEGGGGLPDIVGFEIAAEQGIGNPYMRGLAANWKNITDQAFNVLGNLPETAIGRYPLGNAMNQRHLSELVQFHGIEYAKKNADKLVRQAERRALRDVKEVQFTVERYSNLAAAFEPVAPFFQAQLNTVRVWSKIVANDPSVIARAAQLWQMTDVDWDIPVGEIANADVPVWSRLMNQRVPLMGVSLNQAPEDTSFATKPRDIVEAVFQQNLTLDKVMNDDEGSPMGQTTALSFVIGQLIPQPGGPWITTPANEIIKVYETAEDLNFVENFALDVAKRVTPFGVNSSLLGLDANLPGYAKTFWAITQGDDSDKLLLKVAAVHNSRKIEWNKRGAPEGDSPTWDDSIEAAKALAVWEMAAQNVLPFGGFKTEDSNTFIRDEMRSMYDSGKNGIEVQEAIMNKYGYDYAPILTSSQNKLGNIPATMAATKWLANNEEMLGSYLQGATDKEEVSRRMEELARVIPELAYGEYDPRAASHLRNMNVPGRDRTYYDVDATADRMEYDQKVKKGWLAFNQLKAAHDLDVERMNVRHPYGPYGKDRSGKRDGSQGRLQSKRFYAKKAKTDDAYDAVMERIRKEFPEWDEEYQYGRKESTKPDTAIAMHLKVRENPKLKKVLYKANPEYYATWDSFLKLRHETLVQLARAGSTKPRYDYRDAKERKDAIMERYDLGTKVLTASNTEFEEMFRHFFQAELFRKDDQGYHIPISRGHKRIPRDWTQTEREDRGMDPAAVADLSEEERKKRGFK